QKAADWIHAGAGGGAESRGCAMPRSEAAAKSRIKQRPGLASGSRSITARCSTCRRKRSVASRAPAAASPPWLGADRRQRLAARGFRRKNQTRVDIDAYVELCPRSPE